MLFGTGQSIFPVYHKQRFGLFGQDGEEHMFRIGGLQSLGLSKISDQTRSTEFGSPRAALNRLKNDVKMNLARAAGVDLRQARIGGIAAGEGLMALGGGKRSIDHLLQTLLELHRQFGEDSGTSLADSLTKMGHFELLQVYKNLRSNSSILSAISQTHGNPSELHDFAESISNLVTVHVRMRDMQADDIKPKPFELHAAKNSAIVETLHRHAIVTAVYAATRIKLMGGQVPQRAASPGKPEPADILEFFRKHSAICSSAEFWSHSSIYNHYEPLGLLVATNELLRLAAKVDQRGTINTDDIEAIRNTLKTAPGNELPKEIDKDLKALKAIRDPKTALFELAKIVANYYVEERESADDPFSSGKSSLLNLQGSGRTQMEKELAPAHASANTRALIGAMETGFKDFVKTIGFERSWIVAPIEAIATSEVKPPPAPDGAHSGLADS